MRFVVCLVEDYIKFDWAVEGLLYTTHINTCHDCTHVHHAVYGCCTLHTSIHAMTVHMYTMLFMVAVHYTHQYMPWLCTCTPCCLWLLYTTHINTCHDCAHVHHAVYGCCTLPTSIHAMTVHMYTMLFMVAVYYTHQYMPWLCTCTPCCLWLLYTTHINTCHDCAHVHHAVYGCCTLPTSIHAMTVHMYTMLFMVAVYYTHQYMPWLCTCTPCCLWLLYTTHINTCHDCAHVHHAVYGCCTLHTSIHAMTVHMYTMLFMVAVHYPHQYMPWLCTCTPCCLWLLYTTHINTCHDCAHVHHAVYGCCTLHTSIHAMTVHMYTMLFMVAVHYTHQYMPWLCTCTPCCLWLLYTTHINTCHDCTHVHHAVYGCCTLHTSIHAMTVHMYTMLFMVAVHYTHQYMPWLCTCTPCCLWLLYTTDINTCHDCAHVHHAVYGCCTLHTSIHAMTVHMYTMLFMVAVHYTHQYMPWLYTCTPCCLWLLYTTHINTCHDCTHVHHAVYGCCTLHTSIHAMTVHHVVHYEISEFTILCCSCWLHPYWGLGNIIQKNTTADILIEDQPWPPLDIHGNSWQGARTAHTNSWSKCGYSLWYGSSIQVVPWRHLPLFPNFGG